MFNSQKANIAVNGPMWPNMNMSTFGCKFNPHKADIDVYLTIVAKHDYVIKRIQAQMK